jgi:D-beta-D-heptose 7-phosphate kinase/D-beta-D-heptose 1-phosphate adenosyltransferase
MSSRHPAGSARRKLKSWAALERIVRRADAQRRRVVFTNGCFDLLHAGHVILLERARRLGDALIVAMNSDRSVRGLKGRGRPVVRQRDRARLLAALECVDYVTVFDQATPLKLLQRLRPHVLVKGADWGKDAIVGSDLVHARGGRVVRVPLVKGSSTSRLIQRIRGQGSRLKVQGSRERPPLEP